MRAIVIVSLCVLFSGCRTKTVSKYEGIDLDTVVIRMDEPVQKNTKDYFSQLEIIPLETNDESIIHHIDRIVVDNDLLYILDRKREAVLIFDNKGHFLQKIERRGRGPQEYSGLVDFALDRNSGQIAVFTDPSAELKKYDVNGNFISSEEFSVFFKEIANDNGQDILFNTRKQFKDNDYLWMKEGELYARKMPIGRTNDIYPRGPLLVESRFIHFTERYENVIVKIDEGDAEPVYYLDFGTHWLSESRFAENEQNPEFFVSRSLREKIVHTVYMIRDTESHLTFKTNLPGFVIYDKQNRTADYLTYLQDDEIGYMCSDYFSHDGNDRKMLFTLSPDDLQVLSRLDMGDDSSEHRRRLLEIAAMNEANANPILLIYTFKSPESEDLIVSTP